MFSCSRDSGARALGKCEPHLYYLFFSINRHINLTRQRHSEQ